MKLTLTQVNRTPRVSKKTGKPFVSVGIKANEYGDKWLSGFASIENADWEAGDVVDANVEQKGEYLNFTVPKRDSAPTGDINRVEIKVDQALAQLNTIGGILTDMKGVLSSLLKADIEPDIDDPTF